MLLRSVIFDMDGVLVDSHPVHERAWRRLMESLGRTISDQELEFVLDGRKRDDILRFFLGELTPSELRRYGLQKDSFFTDLAGEMQLIGGVRDFLASLAEAGLRLGVASSASRSRAERILRQFEIERFFSAVVTGDDVERGKPDPAVFQRACERLASAPAATLVVEDAVSGVQGACAAGMKCLGVAARGRAQRLYEAGASFVIADFVGLQVQSVAQLFHGGAAEISPQQPHSLSMIHSR